VISSSQRPLPDNTQHSQYTNILTPGGIRTHNLSRRAAADISFRPRGHWDRRPWVLGTLICELFKVERAETLIQHRNIINYVKAQRLSWFGNVHRKPETSIVRKIYKWQPYVTRPVGRPKHRWDDVRNDLRRMKLLKWSNKPKTALNGRKLWRKPRLYMSCSAF